MASHSQNADALPASASTTPASPKADEYAVRDYVGSMSGELARMARWDGDEALARVLEAAVRLAKQPAPRPSPIALDRGGKTGRG